MVTLNVRRIDVELGRDNGCSVQAMKRLPACSGNTRFTTRLPLHGSNYYSQLIRAISIPEALSPKASQVFGDQDHQRRRMKSSH